MGRRIDATPIRRCMPEGGMRVGLAAFLVLLAACTPSSPVDFLAGSGGEEFAHGRSGLAVPPLGTPLVPSGPAPGSPAGTAGATPEGGSAQASAPSGPDPVASGPAIPDTAAPAAPALDRAQPQQGLATTAVQGTAQAAFTHSPAGPAAAGEGYWIQAGVFSVDANALRAGERLAPVGAVELTPIRFGELPATRVSLGPYAELPTAQSALAQVRAAGYPDAWIRDRR